jgi:hypothetical protein
MELIISNKRKQKPKMKNLSILLETVVNGVRPDGPSLREALLEMDRIVQNPEKDIKPKLRHYLERRSYSKALEWIQDEDPKKQ